MIATAKATASAVGTAILARGGNAVDATIAAALSLNVTYPMMSGLGGDAFALIYDAKTGKVWGVNASGVAPYRAHPDYYRSLGHDRMPTEGMLSVAVPGGVRAYFDILERWGTMTFAELAEPALRYATDGFVLTPETAAQFALAESKLARFPSSKRALLPGGRAPRAGEVLRQPDLARSLRLIMERGPDVLYRGELGERIVEYANAHGGIWDGGEWESQATDIYQPPLGVTYRDRWEVYQTSPPSQGLIMLEELNLVEGWDLARLQGEDGGLPQADAATTHVLVEAKKLAFADRNRYAGDPRMVDFPVETLLSKEFARRRRAAIDPARAAGFVDGAELPGDTTSHVCVDAAGNMVSFIHSLSNAFGCCEVAGDTGILLNNRAGRGFRLDAGHPNCIAPGKRTMHTLNTYLITEGGRPYAVGNTPGGDGQPQWNLQVITNLLDLGMSVAEALAAPRWLSNPGTDPVGLGRPVELIVESRMAAAVREELARLGHQVRLAGPWGGGGDAQLIRVRPGGVLEGASDPRGEGVAVGL
jgi:gamma-glutamyltranspeptidase/glutathione hydrolase